MVYQADRYRYQTGHNGGDGSAEFLAEGLRWLFDRTKFLVSVMMIMTGLMLAGNGVAEVANMFVAFAGAILLIFALHIPTVNETKAAKQY